MLYLRQRAQHSNAGPERVKLYRKVTYRRVDSGWVKEFVNLETDEQ
jgi:hypothetical protein